MDEQTRFLCTIAERLDALGVAYMVSGSVALNVYAEPRMTRDIDVVVDLAPEHVAPFVAAFEADCYVDETSVIEAVAARDMFNIIHDDWVLKADFVVAKTTPFRREELARRRVLVVAGQPVAFVSPEDLLLSKLVWGKSGSELQQRDVRAIVAHAHALDWSYLERWASVLDVADGVHALRARG